MNVERDPQLGAPLGHTTARAGADEHRDAVLGIIHAVQLRKATAAEALELLDMLDLIADATDIRDRARAKRLAREAADL